MQKNLVWSKPRPYFFFPEKWYWRIRSRERCGEVQACCFYTITLTYSLARQSSNGPYTSQWAPSLQCSIISQCYCPGDQEASNTWMFGRTFKSNHMQITTPAQLYLPCRNLLPIPSHIPVPNPSSLQFWEHATMFLFLTTLICLPDSLLCLQGQNWKHTVCLDKMFYKIPFGIEIHSKIIFATSLFFFFLYLQSWHHANQFFNFLVFFSISNDFQILFVFPIFFKFKIMFWMKCKIENTFSLFVKFWQNVRLICFIF